MTATDVHKFLSLIEDPNNYDKLKDMCKDYGIRDIAEFSFERVSHANGENKDVKSNEQIYQLFAREVYSVSNMNPFQLAVIYDNIKALRFMVTKLNTHLRLNLMAPPICQGALQMRDSSLAYEECWPLFVAIQNKNLMMLMYLWQDAGSF